MKKVMQLTRGQNYRFCISTPYLNPEKHITMNHNPADAYDEIIMLGDFPVPGRLNERERTHKYKDLLIGQINQFLKSKQVNVSLDLKNYEQFVFHHWNQYGIDANAFKNELLEHLAKTIYVSENKNRYLIEQRNRLSFSLQHFQTIDLNNHFIFTFTESYLDLLHYQADVSNLYREPKIKGAESQISQFYERQWRQNEGIKELEQDTKENQGWINQFMRYLHS